MILNNLLNVLKNNLYPISLYARQISGTLVLFVIARYLSVYEYGVFSSYKAIASFILIFACLGYNEYILVSSKKNLENVQLKIALFLLNSFIILGVTAIISIFCQVELHLIFLLVLFRTFFDSTFFALILPYFQASSKFNVISYINIIYSFLVLILTLIAYIYKLSLLKFLLLSCLIGMINFIQCSIYARINYFMAIYNLNSYIKLLDKSIWGYAGVIIAFLLYSQIPSLYVSTFLNKEDAAIYFSAFTIANIIGLLINAQNQKIVPEMIGNSIEKIRVLINYNFKFIMIINTIIFITFILVGKNILNLVYGQTFYSHGYLLLLIFTIANVSLALANIYGAYITASGQQHLKIKMQIEAILISILTLFIFYNLGVYAAGLSYLLSATHIGIRYVIKTKQLLKKSEIIS